MSNFKPAPFLCAVCDSDDYTMEWLKDTETATHIEAHYKCHTCIEKYPDYEAIIEIPYEAHHKRIGSTYTELQYKWWRFKEE